MRMSNVYVTSDPTEILNCSVFYWQLTRLT